jgi:hypothetical protein
MVEMIDLFGRMMNRPPVAVEGEILAATAGLLVGAGLMLLYVRLRPAGLGLAEREAASRRLELLRGELLGELRDLETKMRRPPAPIRMEPAADDQDQRDAA